MTEVVEEAPSALRRGVLGNGRTEGVVLRRTKGGVWKFAMLVVSHHAVTDDNLVVRAFVSSPMESLASSSPSSADGAPNRFFLDSSDLSASSASALSASDATTSDSASTVDSASASTLPSLSSTSSLPLPNGSGERRMSAAPLAALNVDMLLDEDDEKLAVLIKMNAANGATLTEQEVLKVCKVRGGRGGHGARRVDGVGGAGAKSRN